ncbi:glycosyltransferase family 2 protein [Kineothrix sedimenti]|uniref:Glycosyltransferase family 2 protein n=1 Tax=Kineothrix sedimenti TaxID=3123317 RepID=A0ABZ3EUX5_9FIRM
MSNVTVIVPVYKDWETLSRCIESLKKYLDNKHKVLILNDMSNEWKELEEKILQEIQDFHNFFYSKNEDNLGFVKTCNRAVSELDKSDNDILLLNSDTEVTENFLEEMIKVLYANDKNGVVCPRSNNATFLSVPIRHNCNYAVTKEQSHSIYRSLKDKFVPMEEIWTGVGFAFLIRRDIIQRYGLFDEIFGKGYNEENDFCMRIRQQGYRIMKANRAYIFHYESKSFGTAKEELELKNSSILLRRYPEYWDKVKEYEKRIDPVDYFSDLLVEELYDRKRVLICILKAVEKKEAGQIIEVVDMLLNDKGKSIDLQILLIKQNNKFFKKKYSDIPIWTEKTLRGTFHIAFSFGELSEADKINLNKRAVTIIDGMQGAVINAIENQNVSKDHVEELRERWNFWMEKESLEVTNSENEIGRFIGKIKQYLYVHHIWIYIWWNRIRKYL